MYIHREIQTDQEIFEMYNALSKDSLIKMLIECNKQLEQPLRAISIDCETNKPKPKDYGFKKLIESNNQHEQFEIYTIGVDHATEESKDITVTSWIDNSGCRELRPIPEGFDFNAPKSTYLRQFDGLKPVPDGLFDNMGCCEIKPVPEGLFDDKYLNWLNSRIEKLRYEKDSETDLSRKINIGGKLCAYNQCLNYYRTHLK